MVEQPGQDREPNPDDLGDAQLPGPEDGPVVAPREPGDPMGGDVVDGLDADIPAGVHDGEPEA